MADTVSKKKRSWIMSRIRGKDTSPEIFVRQQLHRRGFRFRIHAKDLPGHPDIFSKKCRIAVFVHGCFWHQHRKCKYATTPKSNVDFWSEKLRRNRRRDERAVSDLMRDGYRVLIIWECVLRDNRRERIADAVARWIESKRRFAEIPLSKGTRRHAPAGSRSRFKRQ